MRYWILGLMLAMAAPAGAALDLGDPSMKVSPDGVNEFAITVGGFHPTAKFGFRGTAGDKGERFGGNGYLWAIDYLHSVVPLVSVGGEVAYINRAEQDVTNVVIGSPSATKVRGDSTLLMAIARVRSPGFGWRPYLVAGAGMHHTHLDLLGAVPGAGSFETNIYRDDSSGLALMGRAGIEYSSRKGRFFGFEAGYLHTDAKDYQATATGIGAGFPRTLNTRGDGISYALRAGIHFGIPSPEGDQP